MTNLSTSQPRRQHGIDGMVRAEFKRRVATLDSEVARSLYRELSSQLAAAEALDIVLDHLIDLDGLEATDRFIDTVE